MLAVVARNNGFREAAVTLIVPKTVKRQLKPDSTVNAFCYPDQQPSATSQKLKSKSNADAN
jgi:hypothetical protein